ncbi:hypothetical protein L873DRAFT_468127 [Choiromyces venosus 120613-1]|uniref:Uncharacterized protein n=1 Tax=Choiromyces venosus 120613-1 TaxID=1336337 RepID=A0A3N4J173_9PEZI|nr:hypothetical protein L873DRAFT_468127 [Choiromyces venosus 120613-1]
MAPEVPTTTNTTSTPTRTSSTFHNNTTGAIAAPSSTNAPIMDDNPAPAPVAPIAPPPASPPAQPKEPASSRSASPSANPMTGDNTTYHSPSASEYEPESPPPLPPLKSSSYHSKTPKTPRFRHVISGRVEKSGASSSGGSATTTPTTTLKCPVKGCGQTFTGRNPRQSLWHHLKYYATRGLPDKEEFEKAHGEAHTLMKEEAEPKGTPVERNRLSSSDYRKKNPEKAKTSARLSNFRARARKKGLTSEKEIEEKVAMWEKEWQEKQAKEASEVGGHFIHSSYLSRNHVCLSTNMYIFKNSTFPVSCYPRLSSDEARQAHRVLYV